ncbi:MAG: helicase SNF2, partial [Chitinophagia bacterium]|nr:helicase SNF2 [Chitinophagia bacterium]
EHAGEEVIRRGKKIFYTSGVQMLDVDHLIEQVRFRVRNDLYQNYYTVTVNKYLQPTELSVRCQCPYNLGEICRHEVAALFQLNDIIQSGFFENTDVSYDQKHTIVRMRQVSRQVLQIFTPPDAIDTAEQWANENRAVVSTGKTDKIEAVVTDGGHDYQVIIKQNEERYFDTSCGCSENRFPLCVHKATLFLQLLRKHGASYFQAMQNWDVQKNKLLEQYGYSLNDDLKGKFTFTYENGKPFLRVLDPTIKKVGAVPKPVEREVVEIPVVAAEPISVGIVLEGGTTQFPYLDISLVAGPTDEEAQNFTGKIEKLELAQYINPMRFKEGEREMLPVVRKFMSEELVKYLRKNLPFGDILPEQEDLLKELPSDEIREQLWEYLLPKYQKLLARYSTHPLLFFKDGTKPLSSANMLPARFSEAFVRPQMEIYREGTRYFVRLQWIIESRAVEFSQVTLLNAAMLRYKDTVYTLGSLRDISVTEQLLPDGLLKIAKKDWPAFLETRVMQWAKSIHVHFAEDLLDRVARTKPQRIVYLQERENMFVIQPAFSYDGVEVQQSHFGDVLQPDKGIVRIVQRDEEYENEFVDLLRTLHSDIQFNKKDNFYYLPGNAVLSGNWFFRFNDQMQEWKVDVRGFERLKNLRVNTHRAETMVHVSSGIDWFDTTVELKFGDQSVSIVEVKKALAQKQNYVRLGDGSLGMLPEDWLNKYSLLLKVGETKGNKIRLKKYHFSVLDDLLAEIDEENLLRELQVRKERLENILDSDFTNVKPPEHLEAVLRPYQLAGFQWLKFLNEAGWGGILADDMGLGKTIQTLTFFQHYKNLHGNPRFLVVCPTTLMFNWEHEVDKFTPMLTKMTHHGPRRSANPAAFDGFDIVITTYGTMRSDIKLFKEIEFDYVVLDESQSIKNPQSQVAKASLLLNCKNRLALSGTPLQNNTFDLYAQMNFLNPGMLGSREFFMSEFATPIDKFSEGEVKQQLKKLTYPFLLRRTKEQVAKDLPEKTEIILYCEMGAEQRKIYDAYRNTYRSQILGIIEERGMERSQMHILQGLTKLRQICDSPAIMNEEERFPNHSVKLDELTREITENVGDHKVLIFSQFLGMLGLIRQRLEELSIPHVYFDGSSSSTERENAIHEFQNNHECRVFLISLKAGGIGLNLTAAD